MIVNLAGHIASGKTTFATWWLSRHQDWTWIPIDRIRQNMQGCSQDKIWQQVQQELLDCQTDCLFESTGTIWYLKALWNSELANRGIYTIKFVTSPQESKHLAKMRNRENVDDELREIDLSDEYQNQLSANLIVPGGKQANLGVYREIEKHILAAKLMFSLNNKIGFNQLLRRS